MGDAVESESGAFDAFDEIVDGFGETVADLGAVPVDDRGVSAAQGLAEAAQLGRAVSVGEVVGEFAGKPRIERFCGCQRRWRQAVARLTGSSATYLHSAR